MANLGKIDTHIHFVPPAYRVYLNAHGIDSTGGGKLPSWSQAAALAFMDDRSIAAGILSISSPGVHVGDDGEARQAARMVNEAAAEVTKDRPDRFGFFATLTLPDVEGAIAEAVYAFETLHADGVVLLANAAGTYLGNPAFDPLLAELDRRAAVIFVHPSELPGSNVPGIPAFAADFLLDTSRAAISLAKSGAMIRFPNLKIILAHAGGFIPYAAYRIAPVVSPDASRDGGIAALQKFYFDVALSSTPTALPSLLALAAPDHITYGSDWPWAPDPAIAGFAEQLDCYPLATEQRSWIERASAEILFPRFTANTHNPNNQGENLK